MKRYLPLLIVVPFLLVIFCPRSVDTQVDPGLVKWLQDHERSIRTNRQLIDHEQKRRMELEGRLVQMLNSNSQNIGIQISALREQINRIEMQLSNHEQSIKKLIKESVSR